MRKFGGGTRTEQMLLLELERAKMISIRRVRVFTEFCAGSRLLMVGFFGFGNHRRAFFWVRRCNTVAFECAAFCAGRLFFGLSIVGLDDSREMLGCPV